MVALSDVVAVFQPDFHIGGKCQRADRQEKNSERVLQAFDWRNPSEKKP